MRKVIARLAPEDQVCFVNPIHSNMEDMKYMGL